MIGQRPGRRFIRTCPPETGLAPTSGHYKQRMVVVVVALAWLLLAGGLALVIGSGIRTADQRAPYTDHLMGLPAELTVEDVLGTRATQPSR